MATVEDVSPDLRALARRVPVDTIGLLSPLELQLRCEEAAALIAEAADSEGRKADRLRSQANRLLKAMSPNGYNLAIHMLAEEERQARLDGAERRAEAARESARELDRQHPQPDPARVVAHAKAKLTKLTIPPAPGGSTFSRRFGRKRTRRHS